MLLLKDKEINHEEPEYKPSVINTQAINCRIAIITDIDIRRFFIGRHMRLIPL